MECKILKRVTWPWLHPFQGIFFIGRVGLALVNQCTKFEVSRFTRYEAMNGIAKCRKWVGLGRLWNTQGHRQCHHLIECIRLHIRPGSSHTGAPNVGGWVKIGDFRQITGYMSKMVQDWRMVSMKVEVVCTLSNGDIADEFEWPLSAPNYPNLYILHRFSYLRNESS